MVLGQRHLMNYEFGKIVMQLKWILAEFLNSTDVLPGTTSVKQDVDRKLSNLLLVPQIEVIIVKRDIKRLTMDLLDPEKPIKPPNGVEGSGITTTTTTTTTTQQIWQRSCLLYEKVYDILLNIFNDILLQKFQPKKINTILNRIQH